MQLLNIRRAARSGARTFTLFLLAAAAPIGARAAQATYESLVMARNPLAYLMLDETSGTTAADTSGNGNAFTFGAGVTLNKPSADPSLNTAILNDGTHVKPLTLSGSTSAFDNVGTGDFSIETWFNTSNITTREDLFDLRSTGGLSLGIQLSASSPTTTDKLTVFHNDSSGFRITGNTAVTANTWHHLALTRDGSNGAMTLYLDGSVIGTATDTTSISSSGGGLEIGDKVSGTAHPFAGSIDEFAFYNTVLQPSDIAADIAAAPEPGSVSLLAMGAGAMLLKRRRRQC